MQANSAWVVIGPECKKDEADPMWGADGPPDLIWTCKRGFEEDVYDPFFRA